MKSYFDSVGAFHAKFGLPVSDGVAKEISEELRDFRLRFLLEELEELAEGYGLELSWDLQPKIMPCPHCKGGRETPKCECCNGAAAVEKIQDLPKIADALVDLVYVALGTGHMHGLPWAKLFAEVQRANATKERCGIDHKFEDRGHPVDLDSCDCDGCGRPRIEHSLRGSAHDVIKPEGWRPPAIIETLMQAGWRGPKLPLEEK